MFIAQAFGLQLGFAEQFTVVLIALLTSIGVAGIPAASLVAITIILGAIGLPLEAVGLILAVDRVLDMCRTSVRASRGSCRNRKIKNGSPQRRRGRRENTKTEEFTAKAQRAQRKDSVKNPCHPPRRGVSTDTGFQF